MSIKSDIEKANRERIENYERRLEEEREIVKSLEGFTASRADYEVTIMSHFSHVEGDASVRTTGSLRHAINRAEDEFMRKNQRSDISGEYFVSVRIGDCKYPVDSKYWQKYRGETKSDSS